VTLGGWAMLGVADATETVKTKRTIRPKARGGAFIDRLTSSAGQSVIAADTLDDEQVFVRRRGRGADRRVVGSSNSSLSNEWCL